MNHAAAQSEGSLRQGSLLRSQRRIGWTVALLALAVAAGALLWKGVLEQRFIAKKFGVVTPGKVFRSGQISQWMIAETLADNEIRVIVNLAGFDPNDPDQVAERKAADDLGVEVLSYGLKGDGTGDIHSYAKALQALARCEREGKPVLVHCSAGAQRTGGVISLYRVLLKHQPIDDTLEKMQDYGWDPERDAVLLTYLNSHMAELTQLLVENGTLEAVPHPLPHFAL